VDDVPMLAGNAVKALNDLVSNTFSDSSFDRQLKLGAEINSCYRRN
jgi:hypothetical protein